MCNGRRDGGQGMSSRVGQMRGVKRSPARRSATRRMSMCIVFLLGTLSVWPALAAACPPVLKSVTVQPGQNHPVLVWGLPANVISQFIQTSRSPNVDEFGYFPTVVTFNTVGVDQTAFEDPFGFPAGTYYSHVAGHDKRCNGANCPHIEFSDVMSFDVAPPAAVATAGVADQRSAASAAIDCSGAGSGGGPGPLPSTTGGPGPDRVRPLQNLTFAPVQDVDKLFIRARMSEPGTLRARGTVSAGGASKVYRFKTVSRSVAPNAFTKLRLRLTKKKL